jgi:hypothetical protein
MSEQVLKFPLWQEPLQQLILHPSGPDFSQRARQLHQTLESRLRIMTVADLEERQALVDALHTIENLTV